MTARIKFLLSAIFGVIFLGFFTGKAWAEIKINEFSSGTTSDWVEIYNISDQEVNLSNYSLTDGSSSGNTKTFSCILKPKGFLVVEWSKNLNNAGDIIRLKNGDSVIDCVTYGDWSEPLCKGQTEVNLEAPADIEFAARSEDGIGSWIITTTSTKDGPNDGSQKDSNATCIEPSPTPSPSPAPTQEPDPSPEDNPTPQPSPVVSSSPKTTTTVTTGGTTGGGLFDSHDSEEMLLSTEGGEILGMTEPEASEATETKKEKNPFLISVILAVLGLGLVGGTGVVFYKQRRYNETHEESGET